MSEGTTFDDLWRLVYVGLVLPLNTFTICLTQKTNLTLLLPYITDVLDFFEVVPPVPVSIPREEVTRTGLHRHSPSTEVQCRVGTCKQQRSTVE